MSETTETTSSEVPVESSETKMFTQDDVNRIVSERLERERSKFADYDQLKEIAESHKTEQDKAVEAARSEGEALARERFQNRLFNSEIRSVAREFKFHDVSDAIAQFGDIADFFTSDGDVDSDKITKRLKEIAETKPYLVEGEPQVGKRSTVQRRSTGSRQSVSARALISQQLGEKFAELR